jgi:hypothetical protein
MVVATSCGLFECVCQRMVLFSILGPVIHLTHTTPGRLLSHLRKLTRGRIAARPSALSHAAGRGAVGRSSLELFGQDRRHNAFEGATQLDSTDSGEIDLLDFDRPRRSVAEVDELLRRRINRRLVTLASVIEKVEALAESPPPRPIQFPSPRRRTRDPNS